MTSPADEASLALSICHKIMTSNGYVDLDAGIIDIWFSPTPAECEYLEAMRDGPRK